MASGFFALLDDISVLMDDVAMMSKISAKKTAGILGMIWLSMQKKHQALFLPENSLFCGPLQKALFSIN